MMSSIRSFVYDVHFEYLMRRTVLVAALGYSICSCIERVERYIFKIVFCRVRICRVGDEISARTSRALGYLVWKPYIFHTTCRVRYGGRTENLSCNWVLLQR